jgi:hypothetical protein
MKMKLKPKIIFELVDAKRNQTLCKGTYKEVLKKADDFPKRRDDLSIRISVESSDND